METVLKSRSWIKHIGILFTLDSFTFLKNWILSTRVIFPIREFFLRYASSSTDCFNRCRKIFSFEVTRWGFGETSFYFRRSLFMEGLFVQVLILNYSFFGRGFSTEINIPLLEARITIFDFYFCLTLWDPVLNTGFDVNV